MSSIMLVYFGNLLALLIALGLLAFTLRPVNQSVSADARRSRTTSETPLAPHAKSNPPAVQIDDM